MTAETLLSLYKNLESQGIKIWLDGGWGVDALLGEQTRAHGDVDFVVQEKDLLKLTEYLKSEGYSDVPRDDSRPWNFVVGNGNGSQVDIHVINIDEKGDGVYGPIENNSVYPAYALEGTGTVLEHPVLCLSPKYQIESHTGYELRDKDFQDMKKLSEKFSLQLPPEYS